MDATAVGGEDCDGCRGHRPGKDRRVLIDVAGFCSRKEADEAGFELSRIVAMVRDAALLTMRV